MKISRTLIFYFFIFIFIQGAQGKTWNTIADGFWSNSKTWENGIIPPLFSGDTFNIKNYVAISDNIFFDTNALVQIESQGGICGHKKITVNSGAKFIKYGFLQLDTLAVPGGNVYCYAPGDVILTQYGIISNGGSMTVSVCSLAVGPWFNCSLPEYSFTGLEEIKDNNLKIFPNPTLNEFFIEFENQINSNTEFEIYSCTGCLIDKNAVIINENKLKVDISNLPPSLYLIKLKTGNSIHYYKVIKQ